MLEETIESEFAAAGIGPLSPLAVERFGIYLDVLIRWNQRMNLTAVREPLEIIRRHFAECAFASQHLPEGITTLLDFGSGAGFPGIPIAICRPEVGVTLAESQAKKAGFLREVVRELDFRADVYAGRVESMASDKLFDAVAMRAVDRMERAVPAAFTRARCYLILFTTDAADSYGDLRERLEWRAPVCLPNAERAHLIVGRRMQ